MGLDLVDAEVHVDAVGHRLVVGVLHDQVLPEEPEGLLGRRRGEADEMGVEVLQHLPPEAVDRPVALIDDDDVERPREAARRCTDLHWLAAGQLVHRLLVQLRVQLPRPGGWSRAAGWWRCRRAPAVSTVSEVRCCTLYSAGNLRWVSGMANLSNSSLVCLPRFDRSTRNRMRWASA